MKRWANRSIAFFTALLIGFVVAAQWNQGGPVFEALHTTVEPEIVVTAKSFQEPTTSADDFDPEFYDLPNFEDIDYKKPPGRLIEILDGGIYRRSDVVAKNGELWSVLSENKNSFSLFSVRAKVKRLNSISWPGDERDAKLSFNVPGRQIFAVNGLTNIGQGPILTLHNKKRWADDENERSEQVELSDGFRREFTLGNQTYVLRTSRGITKDQTKVAVLVLELYGATQIIKQIQHFEGDRDIFGDLLWVGDLDNDGKLDLYFDEFNEKGSTATELHTSTQAEPGKLVGLAADFGMPGC